MSGSTELRLIGEDEHFPISDSRNGPESVRECSLHSPSIESSNFTAILCSRVRCNGAAECDFPGYFQRSPGLRWRDYLSRGTRVTVRTVLASLAEGSFFSRDAARSSVFFLRSMSALSLLLPLLPRKRIFAQSRARPLLSESETWTGISPVSLAEGAYLIRSRRSDRYWARFDQQGGRRGLEAVSA